MQVAASGITVELELDLEMEELAVGIVVARGTNISSSPEPLHHALDAAIKEAKAREGIEALTSSVRDMLRHGKYKPTGRGKPASEYLHKAALEDRFPRISNLVDINNLVSLRSLLPISLVDLARAKSERFVVRRGRAGESYVFNSAGQTIELLDLLLVAHLPADVPCANPVKDSMSTKLNEESTDVMAVLYAPRALDAILRDATDQFERALKEWGGAASTERAILSSPSRAG